MTGPSTVCANQTGVAFSVPAVAGATTYNWVAPAGAIVATGQGTNAATVNFGTTGGSMKVQAGNTCGYSTFRTKTITINCRSASGIPEDEQQVTIFPNPASNYFSLYVSSRDEQPLLYIVRDLTGREVERKEIIPNTISEFGSDLIAGIYIFEIATDRKKIIQRIVKQ